MSRSSRRAEAARKQAAEEKDFVHTAADRVGPLAQSAAEKVGPLAMSAADAIGAAADKVSPLAHSAANRVGPLAQTAAQHVGPLAQTAADRISPLAGSATERVGPYAERVAPLAATAMLRGAQVKEEAVRRVTPAVTATRDKVTGDVLPKLTVALSAAAASPLVEEASHRAEATLAAARGELTLPKKKGASRAEAALAAARGELTLAPPKPKRHWLRWILVIGGVAAVVVVVVRRFLGNQDADWQAARPSTPYVPPTPAATSAPGGTATDTATTVEVTSEAAEFPPSTDGAPVETADATGSAVVEDFAADEFDVESSPTVEVDFAATEPEPAPVRMLNVSDDGDVEETVVDHVVLREPVPDLPETEPVNDASLLDEPAAPERGSRYGGEGVYVGHEPPEGFVIKGNERSKKYHVPESAGYARTAGEVWFNSEEAAQGAGFVRAQR